MYTSTDAIVERPLPCLEATFTLTQRRSRRHIACLLFALAAPPRPIHRRRRRALTGPVVRRFVGHSYLQRLEERQTQRRRGGDGNSFYQPLLQLPESAPAARVPAESVALQE